MLPLSDLNLLPLVISEFHTAIATSEPFEMLLVSLAVESMVIRLWQLTFIPIIEFINVALVIVTVFTMGITSLETKWMKILMAVWVISLPNKLSY